MVHKALFAIAHGTGLPASIASYAALCLRGKVSSTFLDRVLFDFAHIGIRVFDPGFHRLCQQHIIKHRIGVSTS